MASKIQTTSKHVVVKFGGSSMCPRGYLSAGQRVYDALKNGYNVTVVVSAVGKTTNALMDIVDLHDTNCDRVLKIHQDLLKNVGFSLDLLGNEISQLKSFVNEFLTDSSTDLTQSRIKILSMGEIMSSVVMYHYLGRYIQNCLDDSVEHGKNCDGDYTDMGVNLRRINARHFIRSDSHSSRIDPKTLHMGGGFYCDHNVFSKLIPHTKQYVVVTQGYIATTSNNKHCVLSRSGSDTTASLIASTTGAERLEIWTDVNGMYTADPRVVADARVIPEIDYKVCREASASGSHVLHPYCLEPCMETGVPIHVCNTFDPYGGKTVVKNLKPSTETSKIHTIAQQRNVTLFTIRSDMWHRDGVTGDVFRTFSEASIDLDLLSSSHSSISTTTEETNQEKLQKAFTLLRAKGYEVRMRSDCAIVSIVANNTRTNKSIQNAMDIVNGVCGDCDQCFYLRHYSTNDMNLSFVIDGKHSDKLVQAFHREYLKEATTSSAPLYGMGNACQFDTSHGYGSWWLHNSAISENHPESPSYIYNLPMIKNKCGQLIQTLKTVNSFYFAMKSNSNEQVLKSIIYQGFGLECVSVKEVKYALDLFEITDKEANVLFTPNFTSYSDYEFAMQNNILCVIDNINILRDNYKLFRSKCIGLRIDFGHGDGHDRKVVTEGNDIKFGIPVTELPEVEKFCEKYDIKVIMLHSHRGSGILDHESWARTAINMKKVMDSNPDFYQSDIVLNLGGGLGIPSHFGAKSLDLAKMNQAIQDVIDTWPGKRVPVLAIEPGRYVVAEAGILWTQITQIKKKSGKKYVGLNVGMNGLIRPALYSASHPIYNYTAVEQHRTMVPHILCDVVGPVCESGDVLGRNVRLGGTEEVGDYVVIENVGAYGRVMASEYNMLPIPKEICLDE